MKKLLTYIFVLLSVNTVNAQGVSEVFDSKQITFCGLDFSHTSFVGADFPSATVLKEKFFKEWNTLMYEEKAKYDIAGAMSKDNVIYDLKASANSNMMADTTQMKFEDGMAPVLKDQDIQLILNGYANDHEEDIALVFVVESFDKTLNQGIVHVVFFQHQTGKVLMSKRMIGIPGGFGLKNYWARSVYNIIGQIKKSEWKKWQKEN